MRIWDLTTGRTLLTLNAGSEERFYTVFFSREGSHLASTSESNSLRIFPLDSSELRAVAQRFAYRSLKEEECRKYLHVDSCPPTGSRE
jgi:WD40 repeat protein